MKSVGTKWNTFLLLLLLCCKLSRSRRVVLSCPKASLSPSISSVLCRRPQCDQMGRNFRHFGKALKSLVKILKCLFCIWQKMELNCANNYGIGQILMLNFFHWANFETTIWSHSSERSFPRSCEREGASASRSKCD